MSLRFRYNTAGQWFKGNTHLHSTASDGGMDFAALAELYASGGYDFLFRTDHWVASNVRADRAKYPLLWLDGVELDGRYGDEMFHVVCLGTFRGLRREMGLEAAMGAVKEQGGLRILAHPHWSGNGLEQYRHWDFDGVEVYNHVCRWLNGKGDGGVHWDDMLLQRPATLGFASDDSHLRPEHPGWNGGWIMVNAPQCTRRALLSAIRRGNYYSTMGPEFHRIEHRGGMVRVETSPIHFARLVGPRWAGKRVGGFEGRTMTTVEFELFPDGGNPYCYLEIEDGSGKRAWTNALLV